MPFYSAKEGKKWEKSMYRVINVLIGCFLGVGLSMLVFPRPTVNILQDKIARQIELAGEASEAVLHMAAESFSENAYIPLALAEEILVPTNLSHSMRIRMPSVRRPWRKGKRDADLGGDFVLEKYEAATSEWRSAKSQLGMLKYDPFNLGRPNDFLERFQTETANALARAMRIQTTVVLMDGIVRNDPKHKFSEAHIELLADTGTLIKRMLSVPLEPDVNDMAALELSVNLSAMRRMVVDLSAVVSSSPSQELPHAITKGNFDDNINRSRTDLASMYGSCITEGNFDDNINRSRTDLASMYSSSGSLLSLEGEGLGDDKGGKGYPKHVHGSHVCSLLFLQLAEHLALRSLRLYQSWKQCERVRLAAEDIRESIRAV